MKTMILALALLPMLAFAGGNEDHGHKGHNPPPPVAQPVSQDQGQQQDQDQAQAQKQGQAQGQGQTQSATGGNATGGNATGGSATGGNSDATGGNASNVGNTVSVSSIYKQIRQAPGASADAGNTTSACFHDVRVGFSTPFGGVSMGKGRKSADCFRLELADYFYQRGNDMAGDRMMCAVTDVQKTLGDDCLALVHELHKAEVPVASNEYATKQELDRAFKASSQK